jgi:hypothetical protein
VRALASVFMLVLGCGETASPADPVVAPREEQHASRVELDPPLGTLRSLEGEVRIGGAAARAGAPIEAEASIELDAGAHAVLGLAGGGQVTLEDGARARAIEDGAAQLLLIGGAAHAVLPPAGSSPRPPLRLVTPSATVEIGSAGEVYVVLFPGGASWVSVLGGAAWVSVGEADGRQRLRTLELAAGQAVAVPARMAEPTEGPRQLRVAREMARGLAIPPVEAETERLERDVASEITRLDDALSRLETETRRGRELTEQHGVAVREGNADESQRLQRELVTHAQELYRLRQLATARWERLRAQCLRQAVIGRPARVDPVAERRERVVGLLGL